MDTFEIMAQGKVWWACTPGPSWDIKKIIDWGPIVFSLCTIFRQLATTKRFWLFFVKNFFILGAQNS